MPQQALISHEQQFGLVQVLRGLAATWVLLFHASEGHHIDQLKSTGPQWIETFLGRGDNGVAIFFALSGFVIAHSVRNAHVDFRYLGRFALRRAIRLDPPYWVSIAIFLALAFISAVHKSEPFAAPTFGQLLAHLTYTQTLLGFPVINSVYWTLCYEVQFYLFFILCLLAAHRFPALSAAAYLLLFAVALVFGTGLLPDPVEGLFFDLWHCFFLGVLAYWAHDSRWAQIGFAALMLALVVANPTVFTLVSAATALCLWASRKTGFIFNGLSWKPLLFLGTISYSLYLIHNPVTGASFFVLKKLGVSELLAMPLTIVICIAAAAVMWFLVERPSIALARRIKLTRRPYNHTSLSGPFPQDEPSVVPR